MECSANLARNFGPALITIIWTNHWLYWLIPFTGTGLALLLLATALLHRLRNEVAELYHFDYKSTGFLRGQESAAAKA